MRRPRAPATLEGDRLEIVVTDRGRGMRRETLARCFELGFSDRVDDPGHGLGLAV